MVMGFIITARYENNHNVRNSIFNNSWDVMFENTDATEKLTALKSSFIFQILHKALSKESFSQRYSL